MSEFTRKTIDVETEFLDSISIVISICDLLAISAGNKISIDELDDGNLFTLADRCQREAKRAKGLFDEQYSVAIDKVRELEEQLEEKKPERTELEQEGQFFERAMLHAKDSLQKISELMEKQEAHS